MRKISNAKGAHIFCHDSNRLSEKGGASGLIEATLNEKQGVENGSFDIWTMGGGSRSNWQLYRGLLCENTGREAGCKGSIALR